MQGAFQGQLIPDEQLQILPCTPTITSDHQPGQEATRVKVTVSETCGSVAYNREALERKATDLLTHQAVTQVGASYRLLGAAQVSVIQATITHALAFLSVHAQGTWMYALSHTAQQHIKSLIAGKTKQHALDTLAHLPGIQQATIGGLDVTTRLPKNPAWIHLVILEQLG